MRQNLTGSQESMSLSDAFADENAEMLKTETLKLENYIQRVASLSMVEKSQRLVNLDRKGDDESG